ncbi:hypothetical protein ADN00_09315 [Ornatilinea apprima]|uniref:Polysaccharide biosynthesis protein C-terminal domain-containing protein n=1 Tax=Ornatilinea apprima TaxID=1134406 RepID=A0A0P6XAR3_9CHLR|nr:hypothetical protein ADN00_09315 [Ornatilinea apprima]
MAEALLIRKLDFKKLFFADLFSRIFAYTIVSIFLAIKGFGEWSLVGGTIISTFIRSIYLLYSAKTRLKFIIRKREFLELFSFGGMYSLLRVINYFAQKADNFVVGRYLGVDTLGLYDRAFQIMSYPGMLIGNVLDGTMFPSMSIVQNQPERLKNAYYRSLSLVNIILMPLSIFLVLNAPEIIKILLGKPWMGLVNPLQVLFLVIPLRSSSRMCDSLARAKGALSQNALQKLIYLFVITLGSFFGKRYGLVGVAWGVNFAVIVHFLLMSYLGETLIGGKAIKILVTFKEGLHYSLIVFVVCGFSLLMLRMFIEYAIITLIIEMIVLMVVFWVICQVFPRFFGDDLRWFIRNLIFAVPNTKVRLRLMNFSRMEIE